MDDQKARQITVFNSHYSYYGILQYRIKTLPVARNNSN